MLLYTRPITIGFHATHDTGYSQSDLDDLAEAIDFFPAASLIADLSFRLSYVKTTVRGLDSENDLTAENSDSAGAADVVAESLPTNCAFAVQKLSGLTGRSARGRVYIPGIPQTTSYLTPSNFNQLTTAAAAAYVSHIDLARSTIDSMTGWTPVIVSRFHEGVKRNEGVVFEWLTTANKDRIVYTRRSRIG